MPAYITEMENGFIIHSAACHGQNENWRECTPQCLVSAELVKSEVELSSGEAEEGGRPEVESLTLQEFRLLTAHLPGHIRITVENNDTGNDHDIASVSLPENEGEDEYPMSGDAGFQTISLLAGELYDNRSE